MKRRFSLFTYPVMDMKAAEAELNRRAAAGWRLEKLWLGILAVFVPARVPVRYCINWADPKRGDGQDYEALLADAGWRRHTQVAYRVIYEAPAGTTPIQTDSELEYQRFRKKALRRMAAGGAGLLAMLAVLLVLLFLLDPVFGWERLAGFLAEFNTLALVLPTLPLLTAGLAAWFIRMLLRLWQWRRCAQAGEALPAPGRISARLAALACLLGYVYLIPVVAAFGLDALSGRINVGWCIGTIIGSLYGMRKAEWDIPRRNFRATIGLATAVLVCILLSPLGLAEHFYPRQPVEDPRVLTGQPESSVLEEEASFLVSHASWEEYTWLEQIPYGFPKVYGSRGECWTARWPWMTDWLLAHYLAELGTYFQTPLEGYEDVWLARADLHDGHTEDVWVIRRGNTVVELYSHQGPLDEEWLNRVLLQLEEEGR